MSDAAKIEQVVHDLLHRRFGECGGVGRDSVCSQIAEALIAQGWRPPERSDSWCTCLYGENGHLSSECAAAQGRASWDLRSLSAWTTETEFLE